MEKPKLSVSEAYDDYHRRAREILGDKYNDRRVDGCMAFQSHGNERTILSDLENRLKSVKSPDERNTIIESWYAENDTLSDFTQPME